MDDPQITKLNIQLEKIDQKLDLITNPLKNATSNFIAGVFRSLGSMIGSLAILVTFFYLFSRFNFGQNLTRFIEDTLHQIDWTKIIFNQPSLTPLKLPGSNSSL